MMIINFSIIYSGAINKLIAGKFDSEAIILRVHNHHQKKTFEFWVTIGLDRSVLRKISRFLMFLQPQFLKY